MRNILLSILVASCMLSTEVYAKEYTNSVRGSYGIVNLGTSYSRMLDVLGQPESSYRHVVYDRNGWPHKAISYFYTINNAKYEITVVDGNVFRISWERE